MIELLLEAERAMSFGRLDRAEELYRQVVASDPHNSIAVVGLAESRSSGATTWASYRLARQALDIDPENDAARRLAVRLEEVLATRGRARGRPDAADVRSTPAVVGHAGCAGCNGRRRCVRGTRPAPAPLHHRPTAAPLRFPG